MRKAMLYGLVMVCASLVCASGIRSAADPVALPAESISDGLCPPFITEVPESYTPWCRPRIRTNSTQRPYRDMLPQPARDSVIRDALAPADVLLGVTWSTGDLVSFDPRAGVVLAQHITLKPLGDYTGLAYDRNHHRLYAVAQGTRTLSVVDTDTLQIADILPLRVPPGGEALTDTVTLAYDPTLDILYTVVGHWTDYPTGPILSELATIDRETGELSVIGHIDGPWVSSLAFSETDRHLYCTGVYGAGSWDAPYPTNVIRINPHTGESQTLFVTPYHTMLGFAIREPFNFFSWINWTSHVYGMTDLSTQQVTFLGTADPVGVIYAMIYKNFSLPARAVPIPPAPASFVMNGSVSNVWDPDDRLRGRVQMGHRFAAQLTYDAAAPFKDPDPNHGAPYGISLIINGLKYRSTRMTATITDDFFDWSSRSLRDWFALRAYTSPPAQIYWTLVDPTAQALAARNMLPIQFVLSDWATNQFTLEGYDACCDEAVYSITGMVDHITRRESVKSGPSRHRPFRTARPL